MLGPLFAGAPIIGFIRIHPEDGFDRFAVAIAIAIGPFAFIMLPGHPEFVERPKEVEVTDSGVILYRRLGRKPVTDHGQICKN